MLSTQTHDILGELLDLCRVKLQVHSDDDEYEPDVEIQKVLGNLGAFDIFFKIFDLYDTIESEEEFSEDELNTVEIVKKCMHLMYWYEYPRSSDEN